MTIGPDEVEVHVIVPAEVLKEIGRLVAPIMTPKAPPASAKEAL